MAEIRDGPSSALFAPVRIKGNTSLAGLAECGASAEMAAAREHAPGGACVAWGIPFEIGDVVVIRDQPVSVEVPPTLARWLVFMHTSDIRPLQVDRFGLTSPMRGQGQLGEHAADYVIRYADGSQARAAIRRRHQIGAFQRGWGENCFEAVAQHKPYPLRGAQEQLREDWGWTQTRVNTGDDGPWVNWLWAWENPAPRRPSPASASSRGRG